jgi:hypothetical protein
MPRSPRPHRRARARSVCGDEKLEGPGRAVRRRQRHFAATAARSTCHGRDRLEAVTDVAAACPRRLAGDPRPRPATCSATPALPTPGDRKRRFRAQPVRSLQPGFVERTASEAACEPVFASIGAPQALVARGSPHVQATVLWLVVPPGGLHGRRNAIQPARSRSPAAPSSQHRSGRAFHAAATGSPCPRAGRRTATCTSLSGDGCSSTPYDRGWRLGHVDQRQSPRVPRPAQRQTGTDCERYPDPGHIDFSSTTDAARPLHVLVGRRRRPAIFTGRRSASSSGFIGGRARQAPLRRRPTRPRATRPTG